MLRTAMSALALFALVACAESPQRPLAPDGFLGYRIPASFSAWSPAEPVAEINTPSAIEGCPFLVKHDDVLYFASNRPGGHGALDLYVSRWDAATQLWSAPVNLGPGINTASNEQCPLIVNSGTEMIFVSNRDGTRGGLDLWSATRDDKENDLAWGAVENLTALNTSAMEFGPGAYEADGGATVLYFNSDRPGGAGMHDLYTSTRPHDGTFAAPTLVAELSTASQEQFSAVSKDGREIVFSSNRAGGLGGLDLWSATRERATDPWSAPVNLGANVNSGFDEGRSALSWDRAMLMFHSNRPSSPDLSNRAGSPDLYRSERARTTGPRQ